MKRSTGLATGGIVLAAVGLLAWAFAPRPVEVEVATVVRAPFQSTIDEDGKTRREGDVVPAGAVVAELTPVLAPMLDERTLKELQARLAAAEAQRERTRSQVDGARIGLRQANNEATRTEQLAAQGFVSLNKLEANRLAVDAASKEVEASEQARQVAEHDVAQARAALMAFRGAPTGARAFAVRSPVGGRVLRLAQVSESAVPLGAPLLELGDTSALEVVSELLTTDALKVRPGSAVLIERWGGEGVLTAQVRRIEPSAFTKVSALGVEEQRVKVVIDITSPAADWSALGDGYRVGVRVVTLALAQAVQVPSSAVFPLPDADGRGAFGVFLVEGGRARLAPVDVGARNATHAWVRKGLAPGAVVVVYPPPAVRDGARVQARKV
jgi:HlyD family secretion protein